MSVYVDTARNPFRSGSTGRMMKMCHMLADTTEELHAMCDKLGLKRKWFQEKPIPHYDICQSKRKEAVKAGCVEIDRRKVSELYRAQKGGV